MLITFHDQSDNLRSHLIYTTSMYRLLVGHYILIGSNRWSPQNHCGTHASYSAPTKSTQQRNAGANHPDFLYNKYSSKYRSLNVVLFICFTTYCADINSWTGLVYPVAFSPSPTHNIKAVFQRRGPNNTPQGFLGRQGEFNFFCIHNVPLANQTLVVK